MIFSSLIFQEFVTYFKDYKQLQLDEKVYMLPGINRIYIIDSDSYVRLDSLW